MNYQKEDVEIIVSLEIVPKWKSLPKNTFEEHCRNGLAAQFKVYSYKLEQDLQKDANKNLREFFYDLYEHTLDP